MDVVDEPCADEFSVTITRNGTAEPAIGSEGLKALYEEYYGAFPDFRHDVEEMVAEGDLVGVFMLSTGTHEGEFRGVRPTGNEIAIDDFGLFRISGGRIVDAWPLSDMLGLFDQIGVGLDR